MAMDGLLFWVRPDTVLRDSCYGPDLRGADTADAHGTVCCCMSCPLFLARADTVSRDGRTGPHFRGAAAVDAGGTSRTGTGRFRGPVRTDGFRRVV